MQTIIIDAIAPFFFDYQKEIINWSKIPFENIETADNLNWPKCNKILQEFQSYCQKVSELGCTAVTLDDIAHLVSHTFYSNKLQNKLTQYHILYTQLFDIAKHHNLQQYVTTDYMFFNEDIQKQTRSNPKKIRELFMQTIEHAYIQYPMIDGIILRIGESDGLEVQSDFKSKVTIRTAKQLNNLLQQILTTNKQYDKTCICRTWTLGAYPIGDLIWNKKTFISAFKNLESQNLIISMKYGQADFFRYLKPNPLFNLLPLHNKIIEFQTRREYEGMGEYPSFVGWYYKELLDQLQENKSIVGASIWCQTGGWAPFRKRTFLADSSLWNELNTSVTIQLVKNTTTVENAIEEFCLSKNIIDHQQFLKLVHLSEEVINQGLYIQEFAQNPLYIRRLHLPPLLWIFWNNVEINPFLMVILNHVVQNKQSAIQQGYDVLPKITNIKQLAQTLNLNTEEIAFQYDTFSILADIRKLIFSKINKNDSIQLRNKISKYYSKDTQKYIFSVPQFTNPKRSNSILEKIVIRIILRNHSSYRLRDKIVLHKITSYLQIKALKQYLKNTQVANKRSMPLETFFK